MEPCRRLRRTLAQGVVSLAALVCLSSTGPPACRAGGGPEGTIVVVNSRSWASQAIANEFIRLRQIPSSNVVYLDWNDSVETTNIDTFRAAILDPVVSAIRTRGLAPQIDAIVYSADFPTAIDISRDLLGKNAPTQITPVGSLNGLTYLWEQVLAKDVTYVALAANNYFRRAPAGQVPASHGFRNWYGWDERGALIEAGGRHYVLSTMLAVTTGRGNSVREALTALATSARADGTKPKGTIYFAQNNDVRSKVRDAHFAAAAAAIEKLGIRAEVVNDEYPRGKPDIQGAVVGTALINWGRTQSIIQPGAICEHFTSFGGDLSEGASQTPLTDFLRYGAAGASGTVTEPYAIAEKFPSPFVQVHYARGCSLAEAFYQSVAGPYQLLIVGDPLCRPWGAIPQVSVSGLEAGATVKGKVTIEPRATTSGPSVDRFEMYVDGQRQATCAVGDTFTLDTKAMLDGYHEIRIVGVEGSEIETQGRLILPVTVDNNGRRVEMKASAARVSWGQKLIVSAKAPDAFGVAVYHNSKLLGTIQGGEGSLELDPQRFGLGTIALRGVALGTGGPRQHVIAAPLIVTIDAGAALPGRTIGGHVEGLEFQTSGGPKRVVTDLREKDWFLQAGGSIDEAFTLAGYFDVPADDVYQFHVRHDGRLKLAVDGQTLYDGKSASFAQTQIIPMHLGKGSHELAIAATPEPEVRLELKFGGPGTRKLRGRQFWHRGTR